MHLSCLFPHSIYNHILKPPQPWKFNGVEKPSQYGASGHSNFQCCFSGQFHLWKTHTGTWSKENNGKKIIHTRAGIGGQCCSPSYSGRWVRRITWTRELEVAVSQDHIIALEPGQQAKLHFKKNIHIMKLLILHNIITNESGWPTEFLAKSTLSIHLKIHLLQLLMLQCKYTDGYINAFYMV